MYDAAKMEAQKHKWIESEKAGHDLGDTAIRAWHKNYWRAWCRERWVEHLRGERFWVELDRGDYGLTHGIGSDVTLADSILDRIKEGGENLDIIQWAVDQGYHLPDVLEVLKVLDINSRRLDSFVESVDEAVDEGDERQETPKNRARIMVVDDDEDTCAMLKEVFEGEGIECVTVHSGEACIEVFRKKRFDCYLIDLMLPGKHGAEVAWYLRRHGVEVSVFAISAVLEVWNQDDLYDCGFSGLLDKPFELSRLYELADDIKAAKGL